MQLVSTDTREVRLQRRRSTFIDRERWMVSIVTRRVIIGSGVHHHVHAAPEDRLV
jgi:hypothetical protein